jgi:hypothetical protein
MAVLIPLHRRAHSGYKLVPSGMLALVSNDDRNAVSQHIWRATGNYAYTMIDRRSIKLHRFILGDHLGLIPRTIPNAQGRHYPAFVDHINRIPLDCRRANLRLVTQPENSKNLWRRFQTAVQAIKDRPYLSRTSPGNAYDPNFTGAIWALFLSENSGL